MLVKRDNDFISKLDSKELDVVLFDFSPLCIFKRDTSANLTGQETIVSEELVHGEPAVRLVVLLLHQHLPLHPQLHCHLAQGCHLGD